jgi:DNA-binding response OmpR family regulator
MAVMTIAKPRVLVVDDEPDINLTFKTGLEANGFIVDAFSDPNLAQISSLAYMISYC